MSSCLSKFHFLPVTLRLCPFHSRYSYLYLLSSYFYPDPAASFSLLLQLLLLFLLHFLLLLFFLLLLLLYLLLLSNKSDGVAIRCSTMEEAVFCFEYGLHEKWACPVLNCWHRSIPLLSCDTRLFWDQRQCIGRGWPFRWWYLVLCDNRPVDSAVHIADDTLPQNFSHLCCQFSKIFLTLGCDMGMWNWYVTRACDIGAWHGNVTLRCDRGMWYWCVPAIGLLHVKWFIIIMKTAERIPLNSYKVA